MEEAVDLSYDTFENSETCSDLCPVVLMHGFFWNRYMLKDIARTLCEVTHRKVFSLDLRNHGESPNSDESSFHLMALDVKRFLDVTGLKKVSFVCQSFSGSIAYLIVLERPDAIEKIVMVDSPPFYECCEYSTKLLVEPQVTTQNKLLNLLDSKMTLSKAKSKFLKLAEMSPTPSQEYFYKKAAYDLTKQDGKFKWKIDLEFLLKKYREKKFALKGRGSSEHEILMIRCPGSVRVTDAVFESMLKFNPNARLVTIEGTTHLLMFEKTPEFIEVVRDFLQK